MSDPYEDSLDSYKNWTPNTERDLLSEFSHEVRTPMLTVRRYFQILMEYVDRDEPQKQQECLNLLLRVLRYLEGVRRCTHDHLSRLVVNEKTIKSLTKTSATASFPVELTDREQLLIVCHDTYRPLYLASVCCQKLWPTADGADTDLRGRLLRVLGDELTDLEEYIDFAINAIDVMSVTISSENN